jgi:hypothetical protein
MGHRKIIKKKLPKLKLDTNPNLDKSPILNSKNNDASNLNDTKSPMRNSNFDTSRTYFKDAIEMYSNSSNLNTSINFTSKPSLKKK